MGESKSKARMIALLQTERKRIEQNLASLTPEDMLKPGVVGVWSVKDVLAHLADWEAHMPLWMTEARAGGGVAEVETGLNWKQFDEFNHDLWAKTHIRRWKGNLK